jgi:hypothetical protein
VVSLHTARFGGPSRVMDFIFLALFVVIIVMIGGVLWILMDIAKMLRFLFYGASRDD